MSDAVTPFLLEARNVRGAWVEIESGVAEMLGHRGYAPDVRRLVGEACAAAALIAGQITVHNRLSLQYQRGEGPLKLLVAQADQQLNIRGMAKAAADAAGPLDQLMSGGVLGLLLEGSASTPNYQAQVEARGATLAAALENYFTQSEQLPTRLCLAAPGSRLAGLLLQRLPARDAADDTHWDHVSALFNTLSPEELAVTPVQTLMQRLFPEDDIRVFDSKPLKLICRCSHASISAMLVSLGKEELEQLLKEHGEVEVTCEFCGKAYRYTPGEIHNLFAALGASADAATRH
jgi:molecular chaperone Hsp33